ncbi:MAG TPA: ferritin-like domain-containing protein [Candidatus Limnocylindria bacterium]|nr:ferritin-like domain-containing protein [Candidatus Limnocylindria bacterium]
MPDDVHALAPERFREEVHSFEFWFQSVEGYLADTGHGHRPDLAETPLAADERERLVTALCNYCVGEVAALDGASGLIACAPSHLAKIFLSTQVVDEGRHLEVFLHRLRALGMRDPERHVEGRASRGLLQFRDRLLQLVASKDWEAAIFAQNVVLESLEFAVFQDHAQTADAVTADVLRRVIKDERRHIGFGENELGRRLAAAPQERRRLDALRAELDRLVIGAVEDTASLLGASLGARARVGRAYFASVERLGFAG